MVKRLCVLVLGLFMITACDGRSNRSGSGSTGTGNGDPQPAGTAEGSCDLCAVPTGNVCRVGPSCATSADCPKGPALNFANMMAPSYPWASTGSGLWGDFGVLDSECLGGICRKIPAECSTAADCEDFCMAGSVNPALECGDLEECMAFYLAMGMGPDPQYSEEEAEAMCSWNGGRLEFDCADDTCDGTRRCVRYKSCATDSDCPEEDDYGSHSCANGRCVHHSRECTSDAQCPADTFCYESQCPGQQIMAPRVCIPSAVQCTSDGDCPYGSGLYSCTDGICLNRNTVPIQHLSCTSAAECESLCTTNYTAHPAGADTFCGSDTTFKCDNPF